MLLIDRGVLAYVYLLSAFNYTKLGLHEMRRAFVKLAARRLAGLVALECKS